MMKLEENLDYIFSFCDIVIAVLNTVHDVWRHVVQSFCKYQFPRLYPYVPLRSVSYE